MPLAFFSGASGEDGAIISWIPVRLPIVACQRPNKKQETVCGRRRAGLTVDPGNLQYSLKQGGLAPFGNRANKADGSSGMATYELGKKRRCDDVLIGRDARETF